ncbi:hypothetical protein HOLleu_12987 [Holothuria leucospilota]|uniref:Uncharacterized protein n=1 Tax=Holothuria leucospilota TaxID=206669 RepID=A0A9Q1CC52_HOLLE|nr:hypothetical protein HOLleu_12987 [Holothuria leucospilota]
MQNICALLFVGTVSCFSITTALPASCKPDWKIDWNRQLPDLSNFKSFSNPGEILPGVTVNDTLQMFGLLWNAPSWQEIVGRVCVEYGPFINAIDPGDQIRRECDLIVTELQKGENSNIFGRCSSYWNQFDVEGGTKQVISNYDSCLRYNLDQYFTSVDDLMCDFDPFETVYSQNLLEKGSRIAFLLLEWLGPSPFSGDLYGACSALRILLSNRINDVIDELTNIVTYLVADTLEYLKLVDICSSTDQTVQDILNLLSIIQDGEDICDFLLGDPSRDEYLEKAAALVDTVLSVPLDEELCTDVLTFVSSYDKDGVIAYQITGRNFISSSSRRQFCREISSAVSVNSMYIPTSYNFPDDQDIAHWMVDSGQILPNFSFIDAVKVLGAFLRADKLLDGGIVLCDVFESFLFELEPSVSSTCTALRNRDTAAVEKMCLTMSLQSTYQHPSLRVPTLIYMAVTGVDMARKLFDPDLPAISRDYVCSGLEEYFHSKNNLQSLARFGLNISLAELLPIVDNICKDYDSVYDFLQDRSRLSRVEFRRIVSISTDILLTHLGFSDQDQFCESIADGIDDASGRARSPLVRTIQEQALTFLTDSNRCTESFQLIRNFILTIQITNVDFMESLSKYTGFMNIQSLCSNISTFFDPGLCQASSAETEPKFCSLFIALAACIVSLLFKL